jgi:hypothetical protein
MFAAALYGVFALDQSIDAYRTVVARNVANERMVSATLVAFKLQVQEWKDTLLRGKDPAKLDQYWTAFQSREATVDKLADDLERTLPAGESRVLIEQFATAHHAMGGAASKRSRHRASSRRRAITPSRASIVSRPRCSSRPQKGSLQTAPQCPRRPIAPDSARPSSASR